MEHHAGSEHRLNAALDACIAGVRDAERLYYKVEVTGTDGAKLTAAAMQVPYCIQLQNGSFETPDIAGLKAYHDKDNNTPASRLYHSPDGETGTFFTQYPSGGRGHRLADHRRGQALENRKRRPVH